MILAKAKYGFFLLTICLWASFAAAQYSQYPFQLSHYDIVQYDSNKLDFPQGRANFEIFYKKLETLQNTGVGQINIVQYGGSHIQADIFSGECRTRFQNFGGGLNAGRGFVFPYRLAHTNTPYGYYFLYTGNWESYRNVERGKNCQMGMAGISAITTDTLSSLTLLIEPDNDLDYSFNHIKIYHSTDVNSFQIRIDSQLVVKSKTYPDKGFSVFQLRRYVDSVKIEFVKTDSIQSYFRLNGMLIENEDPGIIYHNFGINGAATASFLRCSLMEAELKSVKPDLVIFGIGINDAYGKNFNAQAFELNYDTLIRRVKAANPNAAIILATNNDSYIKKRYLNRNGIKVQESMYRLAKKHSLAVWDMFEIMGGLNSIVVWQKEYLAKQDRVHFTRTGYILLGDLLFDAIIQDYGNYLQSSFQISAAKPVTKSPLKRK